jgi:hypothetical protein
MTAEAFPLQWPTGWARTPAGQRDDSRYRFKSGGVRWRGVGQPYSSPKAVTFEAAREKLCAEMDRLGAKNLVISTNVPLRNDGFPRAGEAGKRYADPGVAIYFTYKGKQMAIACDRYDAPSANLRSLGLGIEAMRQLERHGGGMMMERAFAGFAALPPPGYKRPWRDVLGFVTNGGAPLASRVITRDAIMAQYRLLATVKHPDKGGTETAMAELNVARDDALREIGA